MIPNKAQSLCVRNPLYFKVPAEFCKKMLNFANLYAILTINHGYVCLFANV